MSYLFDRRTLLGGFAASLMPGLASAQGITDEVRTRWLRDGVGGAGASQRPSALPRAPLHAYGEGERPVRIIIDPDRLSEMQILFALDSAELREEGRHDLRWLGRALQSSLRGRPFLIAGHTDLSGPIEHNLELSLRRARSVRDHLVQVYGISPASLSCAGFGPRHLRTPQQPFAPANRRVEIVAITQVLPD